ncbi:DUF2179 domain-containing protein [Candidatus Formimonas warabiya]|uniref:UPF0316 protein DCMF_18890 n=1 Tax=Formimonas warabiya TaxID=1761012 RepID=A0A3G1KVU9_FORW1|nr:DUF2179 domain-containing protein [Candidatus Formimonas warabiya]ATW26540.1 hypothetical protein DCMF_18890 [Candidatus Formimonas warabiya]
MYTILIILGVQIIYVSMFTIRMILTLKGRSYSAAVISMGEIFIYMSGLTLVLNRLDNPINLLAYCVGYGLGILTGTFIEGKMALGYVMVQIITSREDAGLAEQLRENGFGVTSWLAEGRDADRLVLEVLAKRKNEPHLYKMVDSLCRPDAFVISHEPRHFRGGFWMQKVRC